VAGSANRLKEKPFGIHYCEPLSPLVHTLGAVEKLFFCADHGLPVVYAPGMMSGASAPVTLAGAVTMGNAEALSGVVLHQVRAKGAPLISGFGMSTIDMQTSACIYGCPEYRLAISACADLYHYYGIPVWGTAGASDSHCLDQQAAMEWSISLLTAAMDGANLIHDVGYLGQGLIGHPAALVLCAEIISYVKRFTSGFGLDDDHIGLDVIGQVGARGHFLATRHTMRHFKQEHWRPNVCTRDMLKAWTENGRLTLGAVCERKARQILANHRAEPLAEDTQRSLLEIRKRASKNLAGKHFEN